MLIISEDRALEDLVETTVHRWTWPQHLASGTNATDDRLICLTRDREKCAQRSQRSATRERYLRRLQLCADGSGSDHPRSGDHCPPRFPARCPCPGAWNRRSHSSSTCDWIGWTWRCHCGDDASCAAPKATCSARGRVRDRAHDRDWCFHVNWVWLPPRQCSCRALCWAAFCCRYCDFVAVATSCCCWYCCCCSGASQWG